MAGQPHNALQSTLGGRCWLSSVFVRRRMNSLTSALSSPVRSWHSPTSPSLAAATQRGRKRFERLARARGEAGYQGRRAGSSHTQKVQAPPTHARTRLPPRQDGRLKVAPELGGRAQDAGVAEGHHGWY